MKYKVGDKVKVIHNETSHGVPLGSVVIIKELRDGFYMTEQNWAINDREILSVIDTTEILDTFNTWPQYSMGTKLSPPEEREAVWNKLSKQCIQPCIKHASPIWIEGFNKMVNLGSVYEMKTIDISVPHWKIIPTIGKIDEETFWFMLSRGMFPVNQQLRNLEDTEYVYLRDNFHDTFGHIPFLFNKEYSDIILAFGIARQLMGDNEVVKKVLSRLYWGCIEFSLIRQGSELKALGAGLISSPKELHEAVNNTNNTQREFDLLDMLSWDYNPYGVQDRHYIIDDLSQVRDALKKVFTF